ncbi:MAG TPA: hypothetical protein VFQ54_01850 [Thermomicrobiales bacterium]|nr:hypothetical protein [Thermomicrobiales bacterium]
MNEQPVRVIAGDGSDTPDDPFPPPETTRDLRESRQVVVTVPLLRARRSADTTQPIVAEWPRGHRFWVRGWIIGETVEQNPVWWLTGKGKPTDRRWRVWSGGTSIAGRDVLALPVAGGDA